MNCFRIQPFFLILIIFFINPVQAQDARDLVYQSRLLGNLMDTAYSQQKMSTCKFKIQNKKIQCVESPRVKEFEGITKYYSKIGENGKRDRKNVRIILTPKSEQGIGMLSYGYQDDEQDDDNWMYFSTLGKVRRMTSTNKQREEPTSGSMFGSEYSTEDMTSTPLDDFTYKLLKEDRYQGRKMWVVEAIPTPQRLKKSHYSKSIMWIDQERKTIPKTIKYNRQGKAFKRFTASQWKQIDGIWVSDQNSVMNMISRRKTTIKVLRRTLNIRIENEDYFSQRVLTDHVFQGRLFKAMRQRVQSI